MLFASLPMTSSDDGDSLENAGAEGATGLGEELLEAVATATSGTVGFAVSENLLRILPACVRVCVRACVRASVGSI